MKDALLPRDMLTTAEAAHFLHVHTNTLRRLSDKGLLDVYRIGPRADRRFRRSEVIRFLAEHYRNNEEK